jgi:hypothetical protein
MTNIAAIAEKTGIPLLQVHTNFHQVFPDSYAHSLALLNLSAALALTPDISTFYYSSLSSFDAAAKASGIAFVDHSLTAYMLPPGARVIGLGFDADRAEKLTAMADFDLSLHLDVCFDGNYQASRANEQPLNCGKCTKCARTLLILEHLGLLDRYAGNFNLGIWQTARGSLIERLYDHPSPVNDEVLAMVDTPRGRLSRRLRERLRLKAMRRRLGSMFGGRSDPDMAPSPKLVS